MRRIETLDSLDTRPPNESDQRAYLCLDLDQMKPEKIQKELKQAEGMQARAKKIKSISWWAFRVDECRKRLANIE